MLYPSPPAPRAIPRGLEVSDFMAPDPTLLSRSEIELDVPPAAWAAPGAPAAVASIGAVTPDGAAIAEAPPALGAPAEVVPGTAAVPVSNTELPPPMLAFALATLGDKPALGPTALVPPKAVGDAVIAAGLK